MKVSKTYRAGIAAALALLLVSVCSGGCSHSSRKAFDSVNAPEGELDYAMYADEVMTRENARKNTDTASALVAAPAPAPEAEMRPGRLRLNFIGNLREVFNDSNKYHYAIAERIGIAPISTLADAYYTRRPLVEVKNCEYYQVDTLTHSLPFLIPEAESLLAEIGRNFNDSLRARGGDGYGIIVTSLLRTPVSVKALRRINRNATDSSTHQFGTTFDITYSRFAEKNPKHRIGDGDLKNLLAEVLYDLHRRGKCMVKFERKSPCFHITATGK